MMPDSAAFCTSCGAKFEVQSFDKTTVLDPSQNPYAKKAQQAQNVQPSASKQQAAQKTYAKSQQNSVQPQPVQKPYTNAQQGTVQANPVVNNTYAKAQQNVNKANQSQNAYSNSQQNVAFAAGAGNSYNQPNNVQSKVNNANAGVNVANANSPMLKLPTGRGLVKYILLSIITLGIYSTVIWSRISTELNIAASRYDGKRTMPYLGMLMLAAITLGIYPLYWFHQFSKRVGNEVTRRGFDYKFGAFDFWIFNVLLSLVIVGPFIYAYKLLKAINMINENYNING